MRGYPKPLCILFSDTKGIQWVDTDASEQTDPLKALPTTSSSWMGFRIAPSNASELIGM